MIASSSLRVTPRCSRWDREPPILRGANITRYCFRSASQGALLFLNIEKFFEGKSGNSKAYHSKEPRIGFQRSSPQNNFRRVTAAQISAGSFCFDTVSYVPFSTCLISPNFILGLLNSSATDWFFRLGSTNSKGNEYQFNNLPCPRFANKTGPNPEWVEGGLVALENRELEGLRTQCEIGLMEAQWSPYLIDLIESVVDLLIGSGEARGEVCKRDRSKLAYTSEPLQEFLDWLGKLYQRCGDDSPLPHGARSHKRTHGKYLQTGNRRQHAADARRHVVYAPCRKR